MNKLQQLRQKKESLRKEVSDLEGILKFENAKESLSTFTNGFTDDYLKEEVDENGTIKTTLDKENITKKISSGVKDKIISKDAVMGFADSAMKGGAVDDMMKLGVAALVGSYAKKNMKSKKWKKKIIGLALIYVAPFVLKFLRNKLEDYQKRKSISSMEKLI